MQRPKTLAVIADRLGVEISASQSLSALPMDSLDYLDLIHVLEDAAGFPASAADTARFETVEDLLRFFEAVPCP